MDIIYEMSHLFSTIILTCAFGEDMSEFELDYIEGFKTSKKPIVFIIRDIFDKLSLRWYSL